MPNCVFDSAQIITLHCKRAKVTNRSAKIHSGPTIPSKNRQKDNKTACNPEWTSGGERCRLAAYLGARLPGADGGLVGASVSLLAIFLPGFLLVAGILPLWRSLAAHPSAVSAIAGINAAVVGLLGAALYDPVWTSAVRGPVDVAIALLGFTLLVAWRVSALYVVLWCVLASIAAALWL